MQLGSIFVDISGMRTSPSERYGRRIGGVLETLLNDEPVLAIHGPRSVGKSTVLADLAVRSADTVVDLDDPETRLAVASNLAQAVNKPGLLCVDEYQYVPEILDAIKSRLNRESGLPGTAVLTGSTRRDALPRAAQALTGRLHEVKVWPLSQGEIRGIEENFLPTALSQTTRLIDSRFKTTITRQDYADIVCRGGFPLAVARHQDASRHRWIDGYIEQTVRRDSLELVRIHHVQVLEQLLKRLAGQTAQVLNAAKLAGEFQIAQNTADSYVGVLEDLFLVERLPAWGKTLRARAAAKPKIHVVDSGVAARLLRVVPQTISELDPTVLSEFGNLLESFVIGELRKQVSWLDQTAVMGHWRTHDGDEVDCVIEFDDGRVLAFEVKASEQVAPKHLRGLAKLRDALGARFVAGFVLTTGRYVRPSGQDRIFVMSVDSLWQHYS